MKRTKILLAIAMLAAVAQWAWADGTKSFPLHYDMETNPENGTDIHPYQIQSIDDLNTLAKDVNSGTSYKNTYFVLTDDLDYSGETVTCGNNFTPIGCYVEENGYTSFQGTFDGSNHTISGIKVINYNDGVGIGLFGCIDKATVKNIKLDGCTFTGNFLVGSVAAINVNYTDDYTYGIDNCHVTNTDVRAETLGDYPGNYAGGIIGCCSDMTVSNCTSSATVYADDCAGGIAGQLTGGTKYDTPTGIISNSFYTGNSVTVNAGSQYVGAICGVNGDLDYYNNVSGGEGYFALSLLNNDSGAGIDNATRIEQYNGLVTTVTLAGRTLFKDGSWNTLCLPFDVTLSGSVLDGDGVKVKTLNTTTSSLDNGTLTLNFNSAPATIHAGTPFIIKWDNTGGNLTEANLVFSDVTISNTANNSSVENVIDFVGTYSTVDIAAADNTKLYLGSGNKLYYPNAEMTINSCRAYFQMADGITAGEPNAARIVLNFDDEQPLSIIPEGEGHAQLTSPRGGREGVWLTLDGRRLNGMPTKSGVYINNGLLVVIK